MDHFRVCGRYIRWFFAFGRIRFSSLMTVIYEERRKSSAIWIEHRQNYKGYRNRDDEPEWIQRWVTWAITHKKLVRSHYTVKKDTVYFEAEDGVKHTWTSLYREFILHDQPESFQNWLIKKNPPRDPNIPKPKPSEHHFYKVIPKLFRCKPRRISQDVCNGCEKLQVLLREQTDSESALRIRSLLETHLHRAKMMYQLNSHFKQVCIKSFENKNIVIRRGTPPMEHKGTFVRYEFDYDLDHPEIYSILNMVYFKRKITMKSLNIVQQPPDSHGSRKVFAWSSMVGGKAVEETVQCLECCFKERGIGAERCFLNCDGALLTYNLLKFVAFSCHPKNPKRYFRSIHNLSPETGHSRLDADSINQQSSAHYKKREHWSTTAERVEYINENTNIEMKEWKYFRTLPTIYDKIFLDQDKWVDQFGNPALIRNDKGMIYEFGESMVYNPQRDEFEWVEHPNEMWVRCDEDLKGQVRKIVIFKNDIDDVPESEWNQVRRDRKSHPVIPRETLNDTLEIVKFFPNSQELLQYYTPAEVDESGEIKQVKNTHNYSKILTKLKRREQFKEMLRTNNRVELEKYEREKKTDAESCSADIGITIHQISGSLAKDLKQELKKHGVKGIHKKKRELQRIYKEHLKSMHDQEESESVVCIAAIKINVDQIKSSLVKDLKAEVKNHGMCITKKNKKQLQEMLREHLQDQHAAVQDAESSVSDVDSEEDSDMNYDQHDAFHDAESSTSVIESGVASEMDCDEHESEESRTVPTTPPAKNADLDNDSDSSSGWVD